MVQYENCGGYVKTWFYEIQQYCSMPNDIHLTLLGWCLLGLILVLIGNYLRKFIPISSSEKD